MVTVIQNRQKSRDVSKGKKAQSFETSSLFIFKSKGL